MNTIWPCIKFPKIYYLSILYILLCTITASVEGLFIVSLVPIFNNEGKLPIESSLISSIVKSLQIGNSIWLAPIILSIIVAIMRFTTFKFGLDIGVKASNYLSERVVDLFLHQSYKSYEQNRGSKIQSLFAFIDVVESSVIKTVIASVSNIITIAIILINLIYLSDSTLILFASAAALFYVLFVAIASKQIGKLSLRKADNKRGIIRIVDELDMNFKTIKIQSLQEGRLIDFSRKERKYRRSGEGITLLSQAPKFVVESLTIFLVCGYALIRTVETPEIAVSILASQIAILFAGLRRIIPSLQQISNTIVTIKGAKSAISSLNNFVKQASENYEENGVLKSYRNEKIEAIRVRNVVLHHNQPEELNITFKSNNNYFIKGASGSGKSTLFDVICGLYPQLSGTIDFVGRNGNIIRFSNEARRAISYVTQDKQLIDGSIIKNICYTDLAGKKSVDEGRLQDAIRIVELDRWAEKYKIDIYDPNTKTTGRGDFFSGGQAQRIVLARALYACRDILIIDEGTTGLDERTEKRIIKNIIQEGPQSLLIMSSHDDSISSCFDEVIIMPSK